STMLAKLGYQASLAIDGLEAITAWETGRHDVILMDLSMPNMDGLQATRTIRNLPRGHEPFIVAFTANAFRSEIEKCEIAGMDGFLIKPVKIRDIACALEQAHRAKLKEATTQRIA